MNLGSPIAVTFSWIFRTTANVGTWLTPCSAVLLMFWSPSTALPSERESAQFGLGRQQISLQSGPGYGFEFLRSRGNENADVEYWAVIPSWSIGITNPLAPRRWYGGNIDLVGEGQFLVNKEPESGFYGAGTLSLRYNFLEFGRFVPFLLAGAGMGYLSYDLDDQRDGFNFALQAGAGANWALSDGLGLSLEYRFHHISNANTRHPNAGVNSHLFLIGVTFHFD